MLGKNYLSSSTKEGNLSLTIQLASNNVSNWCHVKQNIITSNYKFKSSALLNWELNATMNS